MKSTNKYNLPVPLFNAMKEGEAELKPNRISVTQLIAPPLMRQLYFQHYDEIEEDVSERLWALLGSAIHLVLSKNAGEEHLLTEKKFEYQIGDWTIVGKADLIDTEHKTLEDYKVTSVWSFILGDVIDWERQLNCYAFLAKQAGFEIKELYINAILRDWQNSKKEADYPDIPFMRQRVELWDEEEQRWFIESRLKLFTEDPRECTDEEKWKRGGKVALMQKGKQKAIKLFDTTEEAEKITLAKGQYLEVRPAVYTRCLNYCKVRKFCKYNPYREVV